MLPCAVPVCGPPRQEPHGRSPHGETGLAATFCSDSSAGEPSIVNGTGEQARRPRVRRGRGAYVQFVLALETSVKGLYALLCWRSPARTSLRKDLPPERGAAKRME
jgi:hypothetical protein